jgi:hypothetical protein
MTPSYEVESPIDRALIYEASALGENGNEVSMS